MPSILSTRQAYQWINRIAQKHKHLNLSTLSEAQRSQLNKRIEVIFVEALLNLEEANICHEDVVGAVHSPSLNDPTVQAPVRDPLKAYRSLYGLVQNQKQLAKLDVALLLKLNAPNGTGAFRQHSIAGATIRPEHLPIILEHACRWFASGSISELNPVEQAAIAFLRFIGLAPFEHHNERTALIAASLFTLRQELPPIIIKPDKRSAYLAALNEGLQMNTQPMVELVAGSIEQSLDEMMDWVHQGRD